MFIEINPLVDYACKCLLGDPAHPTLTLHFLNAVLKPSQPIVDVQILNPIVDKEFEDDKLAIMDILARDATGASYNIEIQRAIQTSLAKRLTYYATTQFVEQLGEGEGYENLRPSVCICLLEDVMFPAQLTVHNEFQLRTTDGLLLTDCLQIHLLELLKYEFPSDNDLITDPLEMWLYFFRRAMRCRSEELLRRLCDPVFEEAVGILEMIQRNPHERRLYQARLKAQRDAISNLEEAYQKGLSEGKSKGEMKGELKGKIESERRFVRMLQELLNLPTSSDEDLANLSLEALKQLTSDLQSQLRQR
jgi:predicted transposase/invertase (TIGR01784 family)